MRMPRLRCGAIRIRKSSARCYHYFWLFRNRGRTVGSYGSNHRKNCSAPHAHVILEIRGRRFVRAENMKWLVSFGERAFWRNGASCRPTAGVTFAKRVEFCDWSILDGPLHSNANRYIYLCCANFPTNYPPKFPSLIKELVRNFGPENGSTRKRTGGTGGATHKFGPNQLFRYTRYPE
jgi:hypothetical protein